MKDMKDMKGLDFRFFMAEDSRRAHHPHRERLEPQAVVRPPLPLGGCGHRRAGKRGAGDPRGRSGGGRAEDPEGYMPSS